MNEIQQHGEWVQHLGLSKKTNAALVSIATLGVIANSASSVWVKSGSIAVIGIVAVLAIYLQYRLDMKHVDK